MIRQNRIMDAEVLLDGIPDYARNAEWFFLKGSVLYQKGWLEEANVHFQTACRMDPGNVEYRQALNRVANNRRTGGYRTAGDGRPRAAPPVMCVPPCTAPIAAANAWAAI